MITRVQKPGVPQIPQGASQEAQRFMLAIKEHVEVAQGVRGTYKEQYVTLGMLISAGVITDAQAQRLGKR